ASSMWRRVTLRFCKVSDVCLRLKAPFRPSATYFDGAKVGKPPASVSVTYVALCVVSTIVIKSAFVYGQ
ncbi:hypothetical protein, partial [Pseudomonas avellanae]|uniref:hypothetical protein n=1 Tax=Pseudomonas avellanae TaxID=46257 RepID=UPI00287BBB68